MQNIKNLVQEEHFQIRGWTDGSKNVRFIRKTGHICKRWEIRPRLLL